MTGLAATLIEQARAQSLPEVIGVASAVAYLLLAIRQNIWCWACAALSTAIYVYLFIDARLYMESALNVFYLAMAAYGWYQWRFGGAAGGELPVCRWPWSRHLYALVVIVALAGLSGYLLATRTDAAYPYVDSMTTWAAIWATFLIARKVLENWWYWLLIDAASIVIYWQRDLQLTALLFLLYVLMIPFGYLGWRRSMTSATA